MAWLSQVTCQPIKSRTLTRTKTVDIYRNKTRESILSANETQLEDHYDTRAGKRRFLERGRRRAAMRGDASRRSAEEVE